MCNQLSRGIFTLISPIIGPSYEALISYANAAQVNLHMTHFATVTDYSTEKKWKQQQHVCRGREKKVKHHPSSRSLPPLIDVIHWSFSQTRLGPFFRLLFRCYLSIHCTNQTNTSRHSLVICLKYQMISSSCFTSLEINHHFTRDSIVPFALDNNFTFFSFLPPVALVHLSPAQEIQNDPTEATIESLQW